jgi:hypothetical protein
MFEEPVESKDGYVHAPTGPGLGFTLRADIAKRFPFVPGPWNVYCPDAIKRLGAGRYCEMTAVSRR